MTEVVVGPVLRFADTDSATLWVETSAAAEVEVLGHRVRTFEVAGHHYALVDVHGLGAGAEVEYELALDGTRAWPLPNDPFPPPRIRTRTTDRTRIVFGSCRSAAPEEKPWTLPRSEHRLGRQPDALRAYALRMAQRPHIDWPDLLLLLGDQVYADDASPAARKVLRQRRDTSQPPYEEVANFEEYTTLYRESWTQPAVRWLLSTIPTAMIFDDHDIIDDWNISQAWLDTMRSKSWWRDRIVGGLMAYWVYQHLGNLGPEDRAAQDLWQQVHATDDATELLEAFAFAADRDPSTARWSYDLELGDAHLVVVDSRAGRVLGDGRRDMLDAAEWSWLEAKLGEPSPHVVLASSLPVLLPHAVHDLERWNEQVCGGAWGAMASRGAERIRQEFDLEHWAAFGSAFDRLTRNLHRIASRSPGDRPASLTILSGDVHHGSVTRAGWPDTDLPLWQVVASPLRQGLPPRARQALTLAQTRPFGIVGAMLRGLARAEPPDVAWRSTDGPVFDNHIATLTLDGPRARAEIEAIVTALDGEGAKLETVVTRDLA